MSSQPIKSAQIFGNPEMRIDVVIIHLIGAAGDLFLMGMGFFLLFGRGRLAGLAQVATTLGMMLLLWGSYRWNSSRAAALSESGKIWWKARGRWHGPVHTKEVTAVDAFTLTVVTPRPPRVTPISRFTTIYLVTGTETAPRMWVTKALTKLGVPSRTRGARFQLFADDAASFAERVFPRLDRSAVVFTDRALETAGMVPETPQMTPQPDPASN